VQGARACVKSGAFVAVFVVRFLAAKGLHPVRCY